MLNNKFIIISILTGFILLSVFDNVAYGLGVGALVGLIYILSFVTITILFIYFLFTKKLKKLMAVLAVFAFIVVLYI